MKSKTFTVIGTRPFPIDMLRYDACWPASSLDAAKIDETFNHETRGTRQEITLRTDAKSAPTEGRWDSFMWRVKP